MNWEKFLGENLYKKMCNFLTGKKMTIATFVRLSIEKYIEENDK